MRSVFTKKGWKKAKLSDVAVIDRSMIQPNKIKSGMTFIGLEHLDASGSFVDIQKVDAHDLLSAKFAFNDTHILYGKLRPYLKKIAVPSFNGICSTDILPIRPLDTMDRKYLFYYLRQPDLIELATRRCSGANLPRLSPGVLGEFPVVYPLLPEQKRIAAVLDKADAIRRKRQEALRLTEDFICSAFLDLFGDPVTNPKGWQIKIFREIGNIQGGLQVSAKRGSNPIEVPYLRVANVYRDRLELSEMKTMRVTKSELDRICLIKDDILIVEGHGNRKEIGRSAVWDDSIQPCLHQNHLIRVRCNRKLAEPKFVSAYLNSSGGKRQLFRFGKTTSGLNTISTSNVGNTQIVLPPLSLQQKFIAISENVSQLRNRLQGLEKEQDALFNSLSQQTFRGDF